MSLFSLDAMKKILVKDLLKKNNTFMNEDISSTKKIEEIFDFIETNPSMQNILEYFDDDEEICQNLLNKYINDGNLIDNYSFFVSFYRIDKNLYKAFMERIKSVRILSANFATSALNCYNYFNYNMSDDYEIDIDNCLSQFIIYDNYSEEIIDNYKDYLKDQACKGISNMKYLDFDSCKSHDGNIHIISNRKHEVLFDIHNDGFKRLKNEIDEILFDPSNYNEYEELRELFFKVMEGENEYEKLRELFFHKDRKSKIHNDLYPLKLNLEIINKLEDLFDTDITEPNNLFYISSNLLFLCNDLIRNYGNSINISQDGTFSIINEFMEDFIHTYDIVFMNELVDTIMELSSISKSLKRFELDEINIFEKYIRETEKDEKEVKFVDELNEARKLINKDNEGITSFLIKINNTLYTVKTKMTYEDFIDSLRNKLDKCKDIIERTSETCRFIIENSDSFIRTPYVSVDTDSNDFTVESLD